jgi:hypothetical protein
MKVGDLFELPENVLRIEGRRGKIRSEDETRIIAKYEVVKIKEKFKGRILVTYGNRKTNHSS